MKGTCITGGAAVWHAAGRSPTAVASYEKKRAARLSGPLSGRADLNRRPPAPHAGALAGLRHAPKTERIVPWRSGRHKARPSRWMQAAAARGHDRVLRCVASVRRPGVERRPCRESAPVAIGDLLARRRAADLDGRGYKRAGGERVGRGFGEVLDALGAGQGNAESLGERRRASHGRGRAQLGGRACAVANKPNAPGNLQFVAVAL